MVLLFPLCVCGCICASVIDLITPRMKNSISNESIDQASENILCVPVIVPTMGHGSPRNSIVAFFLRDEQTNEVCLILLFSLPSKPIF